MNKDVCARAGHAARAAGSVSAAWRCAGWAVVAAALVAAALAAGCISASRTNARLDPGWNVHLSAGGGGDADHELGMWYAYPALQHAWVTTLDHGGQWGFAIQARPPAMPTVGALDLYVQLPSLRSHSYGLGVELGLMPAAYAIYTYHFYREFYVSLTPKVQTHFLGRTPVASAQLALGADGEIDMRLHITYLHFPEWTFDDGDPHPVVIGGAEVSFW